MNRLIVAATLLALSSGAAFPQSPDNDEGLYIGGGVGQFDIEIDGLDGVDEAVSRLDDNDTAWQAFIGWRLNPYISLQAAYIDFGRPEDEFETSTGDRVATGWFVQGQQTLAPRWFVAGRVERMSSPFVTPLLVVEQRLNGFEEVVGFRLTPEVTLRLGHRARRGFGRPGYDQHAELSLVWWKRWL